jgi:hypothetical protein
MILNKLASASHETGAAEKTTSLDHASPEKTGASTPQAQNELSGLTSALRSTPSLQTSATRRPVSEDSDDNSADEFTKSSAAAPESPAARSGSGPAGRSGADLAKFRPDRNDGFAGTSGYSDGQLSSLIEAHQARPQSSGVVINSAPGRPTRAKTAEDIPNSFYQSKPAAISHLTPELKAGNPAAIQQAHESLTSAGYSFMGYHGTNQVGANSMLEQGLHPGKIGSGGGVDKGAGFYLSHEPGYANEYSHAMSHEEETTYDPKTRLDIAKPLPGDAGRPQVMRVYQQHADADRLGGDSAWGVMSAAGDPNHDKKVPKDSQQAAEQSTSEGIATNRHDLEMVVAPGRFAKTAVIPSLDASGEKVELPNANAGQKWRPHEV